jgi:hypothetical protein
MAGTTPSPPPKSLLQRLGIDMGVAGLAGFTLGWFITPIDQAVMQRMSGTATLNDSLLKSGKQILTKPVSYAKSPQYFYVFGTYMGTYMAKNMIETICLETKQSDEATAFYKFWLVFGVNGSLSVFWKDPGLARLFGTVKKATPRMTLATWAARDGTHMLGGWG